jgi:phage protein U
MYAVLGEIEFIPLTGFDSLEERLGADYAEHPLIGRKPKLQFVGDKLDELRGTLQLHRSFCDPGQELARLEKAMDDHEPMALVMGNGDHKGHHVITELVITGKHHTPDGTEIAVTVELNLLQADDTPRRRQPPGFAGSPFSGGLLSGVPVLGSRLAAVISGAKTAMTMVSGALRVASSVRAMAAQDPLTALTRMPGLASELGRSVPLLSAAGEGMGAFSGVAGVANDAAATAAGLGALAADGERLRSIVAQADGDSLASSLSLMEIYTNNMAGRLDALAQPMARMAARAATREVTA